MNKTTCTGNWSDTSTHNNRTTFDVTIIEIRIVNKQTVHNDNGDNINICTSDDICNRFTFWKPDTYNKQEYQAKHSNNHFDILKG